MIRFSLIAALIAFAFPAAASEWVVAVGNSKYDFVSPHNAPFVSAEVHSEPLYQKNNFSTRVMGVASIHSGGTTFVGIGLSARLELKNDWFAEASVAPGYYNASGPKTELGSNFEIRSLLGVGRKLTNGDRLSLALAHTSNADTATVNPGVNSLLLRYSRAFTFRN